MKKFKFILLLIVIAIASFFRLYKLGISPEGFYLDESAIGYNAFSLANTGKDEFGKKWPIVFRSFGDFKAPVYSYLLAPVFFVLKPTVFLVRLPSAIAGILTVVCLYWLVTLISKNKSRRKLAFFSCLFLAISPWHIIFSRTAYETNLALFLLVFGLCLFYKSLAKPKYFILSICVLTLSSITYHANRMVVPIMFFGLSLYNIKVILKNLKKCFWIYIIGVLLALIIALPSLILFKTPGFLSRISTLSIFSTKRQMPFEYIDGYIGPLSRIINNLTLLKVKEFFSLYVSYFSPRYLFNLGDSGPRSSYPDLSTFFVWQFPLYIFGLFSLLKSKHKTSLKFFIFLLLVVSPIPAAMTRDPYSTIRSEAMVIPLVLIIGLGTIELANLLTKNIRFKKLIFACLIGFSIYRLYSSVFILNDYFRASYWEYGYKEVVDRIEKLEPKLPILVDNSRAEPYIHFLFFLSFDPAKYQSDNFEVNLDEYYVNLNRNIEKKIGNISVKKFDWFTDTKTDQYIVSDGLTISDAQIDDHKMEKIEDIFFPDGGLAFRIVRTKPLNGN